MAGKYGQKIDTQYFHCHELIHMTMIWQRFEQYEGIHPDERQGRLIYKTGAELQKCR